MEVDSSETERKLSVLVCMENVNLENSTAANVRMAGRASSVTLRSRLLTWIASKIAQLQWKVVDWLEIGQVLLLVAVTLLEALKEENPKGTATLPLRVMKLVQVPIKIRTLLTSALRLSLIYLRRFLISLCPRFLTSFGTCTFIV